MHPVGSWVDLDVGLDLDKSCLYLGAHTNAYLFICTSISTPMSCAIGQRCWQAMPCDAATAPSGPGQQTLAPGRPFPLGPLSEQNRALPFSRRGGEAEAVPEVSKGTETAVWRRGGGAAQGQLGGGALASLTPFPPSKSQTPTGYCGSLAPAHTPEVVTSKYMYFACRAMI